ncbi:hypothetical protein N7532_003697 [Penicillium argentinense]|uniref:Zn(2)-C6 fungal-type domain-containing protein n=1 Tax=Penicillium argentinense TaxID=1131581 RepID=A0A9W9KEX8_9EURO|nr:uncharacterized protein N7532_003697 [Penicillium argentinense]KAJ5103168.1 hypothetical protein N7532_003697 [Penicillium argentinense]
MRNGMLPPPAAGEITLTFQCRTRHVKCDEGRPTCLMCAYFGLECAGYKKDIFFESKNPASRIRFRRPLLTEEERKRMSQWLITSAPPKSTHRLLLQIDEQSESASPLENVEVSHGPFGVFRVQPSRNAQIATPPPLDQHPIADESEDTTNSGPPQDVTHMIDSFSVAPGMSQWSPGFMESLLEQPDHDLSSTSPDLLDLIMDQAPLEDTSITPQPYQLTSTIPETLCNPSITTTSITPAPGGSRALPQDAVFLLKHYSSTVISLMTPVRHKKTPWHVLFIPHAKDCLAALAMGEELNHASLCAFYGTLAISAFSLGGVSRSQFWLDQGRLYLRQAQDHTRLMLMTAYNIPKLAKYKSTLMAILTMVQLSNFCGNRNEAEGYFLEAEKFIRMKGLKRRKSRKVRLLHHCYVFERMFHESIFICGENSNQRRNVRRAIESSGLAPASVDGLSFRLYKWKNLHQEMLRVRDREEGENDLHLERPGLFSATLYPEIFGIPETWMILLSLIIRLGTEKDASEQQRTPNGLNLKDFISRAKSLEEYINRLERPSQASFGLGTHQSSVDQHILENMLEAMRQALAIYFYRRIYDIDASMLQEKVTGVRDCLLQCEYADSSVVHGSAGFIWPAFIAACEAEDPKVQESFSTWFEMSSQRSGLSCFGQTLASIEKIWQEKRDGNGSSVTWVDLMKRTASLQHGV